jgi:hypothetical protein
MALMSVCFSSAFAESGMDALKRAESEGKTLYLYFYKESTGSAQQLQAVFDRTVQKLGDRVLAKRIQLTDPSEAKIVEKYGLKRAPMPLALVIASNGAVMGGFPSTFTEEQLIASWQPMGVARCLKALQDKKLVLLCLQNEQTTDNAAALQGVREFTADARFGSASEVVVMDPQGIEEQPFLEKLGVNIHPSKASTVMIVPPGDVVAQYQGMVTKERLVADLTKATSGGCCPGGCCPGGCCSQKR